MLGLGIGFVFVVLGTGSFRGARTFFGWFSSKFFSLADFSSAAGIFNLIESFFVPLVMFSRSSVPAAEAAEDLPRERGRP